MIEMQITPATATHRPASQELRQVIIDVLRQQEGLKKKLHDLLDQLGNRSQTLG